MGPERHVAVSSLLALGCGMVYHSPVAALAAFVGGTLIDVDHLLDYTWNRLGPFTIGRFVRMCGEFRIDKLYLLLHSFEWLLPLLIWAYLVDGPSWIKAGGLGLGSHILMDVLGNGMRLHGYLLTYRVVCRFDSRKLIYALPPSAQDYWGSYAAYLRRKPARKD